MNATKESSKGAKKYPRTAALLPIDEFKESSLKADRFSILNEWRTEKRGSLLICRRLLFFDNAENFFVPFRCIDLSFERSKRRILIFDK